MTRTVVRATMLALSILSWTGSAHAGQISIKIQGLDAVYDGFDLYDAGSPFGGNQDPTESDSLTSVSFYDDGILAGTLNADIYADFAIVALSDIPAGGGTAHSEFGGFFDLLTNVGGWGLGLNFDAFDVSYDGDSAMRAWGVSSGIAGQALPFGLVTGGPLHVVLDLQLSNLVDDGASLTGFDVAGLAQVPEPASLLLFGFVGLAAARGIRKCRRTPLAGLPDQL